MSKKWYDLFVVRNAGETGESSAAQHAETAPPVEIPGPVSGDAAPEAIYAAAQIAVPGHGFSILKVAAMLESEHIRELPADVRRKSVLVALDAAQVPLKEIVEDAVRRDRALDTYERVLERDLASLQASALEENQRLEAQIAQLTAELREKMQQNDRAVGAARAQFTAWRTRKQAEESRIAAAVGFFVDDNPISLATGGQE